MKRGDKIHLADGEHEIVGVDSGHVFIERLSDQAVKKYTLTEAETLVSGAKQKGWYTGPWPFITTSYLYDEEWSLNEKLEEMGLSQKERRMFKHIVNELPIEVELHSNGDIYIVSVAGNQLDEKIKVD